MKWDERSDVKEIRRALSERDINSVDDVAKEIRVLIGWIQSIEHNVNAQSKEISRIGQSIETALKSINDSILLFNKILNKKPFWKK